MRPEHPTVEDGFDAVGIMLAAIKKVGPAVTRETLRDALAGTADYPGVTGVTTFDPQTREPAKTLARMIVTNGKYSVIR
jgi:branched-chain amino acid transport system substrate-binding protein